VNDDALPPPDDFLADRGGKWQNRQVHFIKQSFQWVTPFVRILSALTNGKKPSEGKTANKNREEPCAVMSARTDLWELWVRNYPVPPGQHSAVD